MEGVTPGRIVHYVMCGQADIRPAGDREDGVIGAHRSAVIVDVVSDTRPGVVDLMVFTRGQRDGVPACTLNRAEVPYSEEKEYGTWHWIERA